MWQLLARLLSQNLIWGSSTVHVSDYICKYCKVHYIHPRYIVKAAFIIISHPVTWGRVQCISLTGTLKISDQSRHTAVTCAVRTVSSLCICQYVKLCQRAIYSTKSRQVKQYVTYTVHKTFKTRECIEQIMNYI